MPGGLLLEGELICQFIRYIRRGTHHIDKQDFLQAYLIARTEAATTANIRSGFAATGLVPHDPERVLSKLCCEGWNPFSCYGDAVASI